MLHLTLSRYVKDGLSKTGFSYRELSSRSGVPISTISAYARGQVASPDADNLARIAQAFGDGPDTVSRLRADAEAQAEEDARIAAEANDKELVERIASMLRQTFDGLLDDANEQYAQRLAAVQDQYKEYLLDAEQIYAERMEAEQRHHAQIIAELRANAETIDRRSEDARRYLKRLVRVLAVAVMVLMILLGMFAAYGVYAFNTFDRNDYTRGLYQENTVQQNSE